MKSNRKIRALDMQLIEDLFEMGGGYVLHFSNRTFAEFFKDELGIDIYDPQFAIDGTSKAKRLRYFLNNADNETRIKTLLALWEYRQAYMRRNRLEESYPGAESEFYSLVERLGGSKPAPTHTDALEPGTVTTVNANALKTRLVEISQLEPQPRGFAFEKFLKDLFEAQCLAPRASFRLQGEQIDGSFQLSSETYLLEAKWTNAQVGVSELHAFHGKIEQKAAWSRGLFISQSGFTKDGLAAFGKGKRVICMDGLDLYEMLDKNIPFGEVVSRKARRAAENGSPFVRVRDLGF